MSDQQRVLDMASVLAILPAEPESLVWARQLVALIGDAREEGARGDKATVARMSDQQQRERDYDDVRAILDARLPDMGTYRALADAIRAARAAGIAAGIADGRALLAAVAASARLGWSTVKSLAVMYGAAASELAAIRALEDLATSAPPREAGKVGHDRCQSLGSMLRCQLGTGHDGPCDFGTNEWVRDAASGLAPCFGCATTGDRSIPCPECGMVLCQRCAEVPDIGGYICCCDVPVAERDALSTSLRARRAAEDAEEASDQAHGEACVVCGSRENTRALCIACDRSTPARGEGERTAAQATEQQLSGTWERGREAGRVEERADVVAYLREREEWAQANAEHDTAAEDRTAARRIEAGSHDGAAERARKAGGE